jgi:hypothetical protein
MPLSPTATLAIGEAVDRSLVGRHRLAPTTATATAGNELQQKGEHMSQRYQVDHSDVEVEIVGPGTDLGGDQLGPARYALVIGDLWASACAIEGSLSELGEFARRVTTRVEHTATSVDTGLESRDHEQGGRTS